MNLPKFSIERPVTTIMIFLLVVVLGVVSISRLNIDLFPKMTFPVAAVFTSYEGVGPQEIENLVTRPLEEALATVTNVEKITTLSSAGQSTAVVQFDWDTDMDFALLDIREKVDLIKGYLPDGVENPLVFKFDPAMMPIINMAVSGGTDLVSLKTIADEEIKPRLERLSGVASVSISGGFVPIIKITADPVKLQTYGLTLQQITQMLQAENLNLPGGTVRSGDLELMVRTTGQFQQIEEIANLPLVSPRGTMVKLKEVATVSNTYKEQKSYVLLDGQTAVGISVQKETDANTVNVSRLVRREMEKIAQELPAGIKFEMVMDQADFIQLSIDNLKSSALLGGFLAVIILFLFLKSLASTVIIGISIPISIITTFVLLYFAKLDLNMMTIGGLALGVGMLVDNSIVVLENIHRLREEGADSLVAALKGSSEVGMAIVASTLTTVVVFLPVVFMGGMTAQIFKELALTVTFSLLASLLVAQTLVPMLASRSTGFNMRSGSTEGKVDVQAKKGYLSRYHLGLEWALNHRKTVIIVICGLLVISTKLLTQSGAEFLPRMDSGYISVQIQMAKGTRLNQTEAIVNQVETIIAGLPETETVFTNVGGSDGMGIESAEGDQASITIRLKEMADRDRSAEEVAEAIRVQTATLTGAEVQVQTLQMFSMGSAGKPINLQLKGEDLRTLDVLASDLVTIIKEVEGTREVETSLDEGRPELQVVIDRERASALGLTAYTIASYLRTAIEGTTATRFTVQGEELDVVVGLAGKPQGVPDLNALLIPTPSGAQVPLSEVAAISVVEGPNVITRDDQERVVTISAALVGRDLNSAIGEIRQRLATYPLPSGYSLNYAGEAEEMFTAFRDLLLTLLLAVIFVYMILASQFESFLQPFTIMLTVPLAFIGVALGLAISGHRISVPGLIGMIMLAGIVVNNAIVLIDYVNQLRRGGMGVREAILTAGPTRVRPILMTSLTTILGLLPMAVVGGEGSELQAPMAVSVIGGLTVATFLTLFVVPVFYLSFDQFGQKRKDRRARKVASRAEKGLLELS